MGGVHGHPLYVHGHGSIHRLAPELKVVATLLFVVAVVLTPRSAFWAFGAYAVLVAGVIVAAGLPAGYVLRRLVFELPFVLFAVFLPFIGQGERVEVLGLSLSMSGLWGAWNIVVKGTLGVAASIVLAATTTVPELLRGLDHLRMPKVVTAIMGFMIRYGDVIADDMRRMKIARQSRGYDPKWIWQAKGVAASAGSLFIRSFERGERVHVAMLARGYDGTMPLTAPERRPAPADWARALTLPVVAAAIAAVALVAQ